MTAVVSKFVTQTLCDNQGCLDFKHLKDAISLKVTVADQILRTVLFDNSSFAIEPETQKAHGSQQISPDRLVVAKTSLRICQVKAGGCVRCDYLHLCRYFVCGECTFGNKCKNPHSLTIPHNAEILKKCDLQHLTEKQLFQLLLQNDPFLLPEICPHYNKGDGVYGSCKFTTSCTKLHICQHYVQGDCKFASTCKRSHAIDANSLQRLFKGYSHDNIKNLYKIYRNKSIITGRLRMQGTAIPVPLEVRTPTKQPRSKTSCSNPRSPATSPCPNKSDKDADGTEICLYSVLRHCRFKEKCVRVHWHLPYRWQVLDGDGATWNDLPNMEDIEKAYCNPQNDTSSTAPPSSTSTVFRFLTLSLAAPAVQSVDFTTMKYGGSPVRRLSTASSASKPPQYILTTEWLWYWREDSGVWLEYGQDGTEASASVTSQTLETVYLADRDAEVHFSAGKQQQYILHLKDAQGNQLLPMYQQNLKYQTKRQVRRRPRFVSAQDVELKLSLTSSSGSSTPENIPPHWDTNALPDFGYKLVLLTPSTEYSRIETLFKKTMPQSKLNSIQRIQNPSLWKVFHWQKEQMKAKNGGKQVLEKELFHGTDESLIEPICGQNFDWRMCGIHGTAYGKGSYFARDASYSARYSTAKGNVKIMFVALVLVGEYTNGSSSFVRPPPKGSGKTLYDSCVDRSSDPSIFVIFEKYQIYPEYVIKYS